MRETKKKEKKKREGEEEREKKEERERDSGGGGRERMMFVPKLKGNIFLRLFIVFFTRRVFFRRAGAKNCPSGS